MTVLAGPSRVQRPVSGGRRAGQRDQLGRMPLDLWQALAGDTEARARYYRKVYWRGPGQCAFFLGALGSGGHGRFRAGTRRAAADRPASLVVPAHVYGYVLSRGVPRPDPVSSALPLIRHRCDEPSCQAAGHLAAGSAAENAEDYLARRREVAIRNAILAALAEDAGASQIEAVIERVSAAGIPSAQQMLF